MTEEIDIKLITKQEEFVLPDVVHSVSLDFDEHALNHMLTTLLQEENGVSTSLSFDFSLQGELLRKSLREYINEKAISTECTVEIEYFLRTPAPEPEGSILHDDWIYCISASNKWILTGCYDNTVNLCTPHGNCILNLKSHKNFVKGVKWISKEEPQKGFVSVSEDGTGILWNWQEDSTEAKERFILKGHSESIESVDVCQNGQKLATGGWDINLKIWSASLDEDEEEPASKRGRNQGNGCVRTPLVTLNGHNQGIMAVEWMNDDEILTGSMDHTMKIWDAQLGGMKHEIITNKAILCVSWSRLSNSLLTGSADDSIRLYDPRSMEGTVCKQNFKSHQNWVKSVKWSPINENHFVSGGYDKMVKMWDRRSPSVPLFDLQDHEGKVFAVEMTSKYIISGGDDNHLHLFKG